MTEIKFLSACPFHQKVSSQFDRTDDPQYNYNASQQTNNNLSLPFVSMTLSSLLQNLSNVHFDIFFIDFFKFILLVQVNICNPLTKFTEPICTMLYETVIHFVLNSRLYIVASSFMKLLYN